MAQPEPTDGDGGSPHHSYSNNSFESSLVRYPCRTVCNIFWGNRLATQPYYCDGDRPVAFSSLWPDVRTFVELYSEGEMTVALPDIIRLLLASRSYPQLEGLVERGHIGWDHRMEQDQCTLIHLLCALKCEPLVESALKQLPQNGLLGVKDKDDRTPVDVCFSPGLLRKINAKRSFWSKSAKSVQTGLQLTTDVRQDLFREASSSSGLYQLAILLQMYKVDVNTVRNEAGNLLLHTAISGGLSCLPNVFLLVNQFGANVNLPNQHEMSPLSYACQLGQEKVAEVLVCVFGATVNVGSSSNGWTALHYSANHNHPDLVRMLLTRGADACCEDTCKRDPAYLAQKNGATECMQILALHNKERASSLAQQALEGDLEVDKLFPSDINLVTDDGYTLLMKAVLGNHPTIVRALLNCANCPIDFRQMRLPDLSDIEGSWSSAIVPSVADQPLKTAVTLAATNGFNECLQILIDAGADPAIEDAQKWLPLHYACQGGHYKCVKTILDHPRGKGLTRLKLATSLAEDKGKTEIVSLLKQARQKRQKHFVSDRLFEIAVSGDQEALFQLLEDGDDVNPKNEASDWPILMAAGFGNLEVIKMLHKQGGHVVQSQRYNMNTPLHTAARGGHLDVVRYLLTEFCPPPGASVLALTMASRRFLDVNDKNVTGATPLELAAQHGHMKVVRLLLDHGAVTTLPDSNNQLLSCRTFGGIQFLLESRRREQLDRLIRALVDQKPLKDFSKLWQGPSDFNHRDTHWNTILMVAARHAKLEILEFLLQSATHYTSAMKINWSARASDAASPGPQSPSEDSNPEPMYYDKRRPVKRRHSYTDRSRSVEPSRMRQYGYYGPPPNISEDEKSMSGEAVAAALNGVDEVVEGPCTQSGIVCLVNREERTALHCAVNGNKHRTIPLLLQADPLVANMQDNNGQTALHLACHLNYSKCVKALTQCPGVTVDSSMRDNASNLAEDLCVNGRLKKKVVQYRIQQIRSGNHPAQRPLPPIPQVVPLPAAKPHPPGQYENIEHYSRLEEYRGRRHRLPNGDVMDGTISGPEQRDLYHRQRRGIYDQRSPRHRHRNSPPTSPEVYDRRRHLSPIHDNNSPPSSQYNRQRRESTVDSLPERVANLRPDVYHAHTSDDTDS